MSYIWFRVGDYVYCNGSTGNTNVTVRVAPEIRKTATSVSAIPSTVTYGGVTYTVKYLYGQFPSEDKPYGTYEFNTGGRGCFQDCNALTQIPTFPQTIDYSDLAWLYYKCYAVTSFPTLPTGAIELRNTYSQCREAQTFPAIPSTVTKLTSCFAGCSKMQTAPSVPSAVTRMNYAFQNCTSLSGNITVNNTPTDYVKSFDGTVNDIYIINGGSAGTVWKNTIAPAYSNVHYEADDHPAPTLSSITATRVASNGSTTFAEEGLWAYLTATVSISTEYLPVGWTSEFGSTTTKQDGTTITPTWNISVSADTITLTAWVNVNDLSSHVFSLSVSELVKEGSTTKKTVTSSTMTATLTKAYALVDYYHDTNTGTEGMAIGKYAESADLLDCALPAIFEDDVYIALLNYQTSGSTDKEIYDNIVALGWDSDVLS